MKTEEKYISSSLYRTKSPYSMTPQYITIHNTANDASANNEYTFMTKTNASSTTGWHIVVDDVKAIYAVPLNRNSWHAGDGANGTGNRRSIGIEICYSKSGGERYNKAEENCVQLVAMLLKRYGWGIDRVKKHQDWSGKYCLPLDCTELLTPTGWKQLADINIGDIVAQYNDGKIEFVEVQDIVEPYEDDVLKVYKTEATADHRMWSKQSGSKYTKWDFKTWGEILSNKTWHNIPTSGQYEAKGLDISDEELLLLAWVQGDGHYMKRTYKDGEHYLGIEFHLSKERKINRLKQLLDEANYKYSCNIQKDGTTKIRLFGADYVKHFEEYLTNKCFDYNLLEMDKHQFELFIDELLIVDGCKENNSYCSTIQQNYDVIQALCSINNVRTNQMKTGNSTALTITDRNLSFSGTQDIEERKTLVSCVTVPSGKILIRQYGQPKVVGNCPHRILAEGRWNSFKNRIAKAMGGTPTPDKPNTGSTVYRVRTMNGSYLEWVRGYGNGTDGYAGVYGRSIDGLQIQGKTYQVHIKGMLRGKWLNWVTGYGKGIDGYAGIYGRAIDGIRVKGTAYRVHLKGGSWLPWVNKCDNTNNGYAGIYGKEIDGIQIR